MTLHKWWSHEEVGHTDEAKKEMIALYGSNDVFDTPKPERLLKRILEIATNPGDLILDSFAGSGTTGAVAHKMGRRWIMVELGEHARTHIVPRLRKVIDGDDAGGVTKDVAWQGGGGFRYYRLAPSLLEQDRWGNWVINKAYNAEMLTEALCKLEGFTYAPSETVYWQQGYSTERDFAYVTTATLTHEQLLQLSEELGPNQTLLVLCPAFTGAGDYPNLTVKKIPKHVLNRCEWGHDDYSLRVENLPQMPVPEGHQFVLIDFDTMNRHVNAIAGRLSLRLPQRRSLELLDQITELVPPKKQPTWRPRWPFSAVNFRPLPILSANFRRFVFRWQRAWAKPG